MFNFERSDLQVSLFNDGDSLIATRHDKRSGAYRLSLRRKNVFTVMVNPGFAIDRERIKCPTCKTFNPGRSIKRQRFFPSPRPAVEGKITEPGNMVRMQVGIEHAFDVPHRDPKLLQSLRSTRPTINQEHPTTCGNQGTGTCPIRIGKRAAGPTEDQGHGVWISQIDRFCRDHRSYAPLQQKILDRRNPQADRDKRHEYKGGSSTKQQNAFHYFCPHCHFGSRRHIDICSANTQRTKTQDTKKRDPKAPFSIHI